MLSTKLITKSDVKQYKQISETAFSDVFDAIVLETQIQDIAPLLGEGLFNDLMLNTDNYDDLLNGGAYTHSGMTYQNYGLKAVVCYYFYARYQMFGNVVDTPFSLVEKLDNEGKSQQVSQRTKDALYQLNRDSAFTIWKSVENYLIRTNNTLFNSLDLCKNRIENKSSFKISKIC